MVKKWGIYPNIRVKKKAGWGDFPIFPYYQNIPVNEDNETIIVYVDIKQ